MLFSGKKPAGQQRDQSRFRQELCLYIPLYLIFFAVVFLPVIIRDGMILGSDGYNMYYPMLVNFRNTLLDFFRNIGSGSFAFPMMNFNFGFGTDNLTMLPSNLAILPLSFWCILLPESCMPAFLTVIIFILVFLSGITFLMMCRHFGHQSLWNSLMALGYTFSTSFLDNLMYNPHFICMMVAFPLMVIGIDRVIRRKGWRLLCFSTFWLSLSSFTLLLYTLPLLALFALLRVWFLYPKRFIPELFKAFFRCVPLLVCGFLLSAWLQLPILYLLKNSTRSIGNEQISFVRMLIPELSRMRECFFLTPVDPELGQVPYDISAAFFAIPGLLLTLLVLRKHRELRTYLIAMILFASVPLTDYAMNGFQYKLIRWGFVPALLFSFAGSVGMTEFAKLSRKQYLRSILIAAFCWIMFSSQYMQHYEAGFLCAALITAAAVCRLIPPAARCFVRFGRALGNHMHTFRERLKENTPSAGHYLAVGGLVLGICCFLSGTLLLILLPHYTFHPQLLVNGSLMIAASVILLLKKQWAGICMKLLSVCFFGCALLLYSDFHRAQFAPITPIPLFEATAEIPAAENSFGRRLYVRDPLDYRTDEETADENSQTDSLFGQDTAVIEQERKSRLPKMFYTFAPNNSLRNNFSIVYNQPDISQFHNMIDKDLFETLERCGMDQMDFSSVCTITGLGQNDVLYSLFGVETLSKKNGTLTGTDLAELRTVSGEKDTFRIYNYPYALPAGVTYDSYISRDDAEALEPYCYPYALLRSAFTEEPDGSSMPGNTVPDFSGCRCSAEMTKEFVKKNSLGMEISRYRFRLQQDVSDCFLYITLKGVTVNYPAAIAEKHLFVEEDGENKHTFVFSNNNSEWPWIRHADSYALPLGYHAETVGTIEFELPAECSEIGICAVPVSVLREAYAERTEEILENVRISTNQVEGNIAVSSDKLLSVSLIHNDGWRAEVDGVKVPLCKVNGLFLGIHLTEGTHHVRLFYRSAWLGAGIVCTFAGLLLWLLTEWITRRKKRQCEKA